MKRLPQNLFDHQLPLVHLHRFMQQKASINWRRASVWITWEAIKKVTAAVKTLPAKAIKTALPGYS
jgi:hypothetical protein